MQAIPDDGFILLTEAVKYFKGDLDTAALFSCVFERYASVEALKTGFVEMEDGWWITGDTGWLTNKTGIPRQRIYRATRRLVESGVLHHKVEFVKGLRKSYYRLSGIEGKKMLTDPRQVLGRVLYRV